MASADPHLDMGSSAALPSLSGCCRNKFPLLVSELLEGAVVLEEVVLGIVGDTFLERHLERRNMKLIVWRCDSFRDEGSPQLHIQRSSGSKLSLIDFGSFPYFLEISFHFSELSFNFSSILPVISYNLSLLF